MTDKPGAPATLRNREPILEVLRIEMANCQSVLEIGSGTGQHAVFFGRELPWLSWQTSDRLENHDGINAWIAEASLPNVRRPLDLDVELVDSVPGEYGGVFSANTAHIMSFDAVICMFQLVGNALTVDGLFCLYGPFNLNNDFTSESNRRFDASLKTRDPRMGIRDLEEIKVLASENNLVTEKTYAMPANNMLIVWKKHRRNG